MRSWSVDAENHVVMNKSNAHGLVASWAPRALMRCNLFSTVPALKQNQFGAAIGGITQGCISSVAQNLLNYVPVTPSGTYVALSSSPITDNTGHIRVDWNQNAKDLIHSSRSICCAEYNRQLIFVRTDSISGERKSASVRIEAPLVS